MNGEHRYRLALFLVLVALMTPDSLRAAGRSGAALARETVRQIRSRHALTLVYRFRNDDLSRAVLPHLADMAVVYGADGLAVVVIGSQAGMMDPGSYGPLFWLQEDDGDPSGAVLTMHRGDGTILAAMQEAALDLYAVYRICERELRGRGRSTLVQHVERVIEHLISKGCMTIRGDGSGNIPLADLLRMHPRGCLLVPPGCGACILEKSAALLGRLFLEQVDIPVLVFDSGGDRHLRGLGWQGAGHLLPADSETRLLGLRQAGNYQPVLVTWHDPGGVEVRSIRSEDGS